MRECNTGKEINPWLILSDALFGGVNGLLAVSGIGILGSAFLGASLNALQLATNAAITGDRISEVDFLVTISMGILGAFIPNTSISVRKVSQQHKLFKTHIKNAVKGLNRYNLYFQKLRQLYSGLMSCSANYVANTLISNAVSNHATKELEIYYGY